MTESYTGECIGQSACAALSLEQLKTGDLYSLLSEVQTHFQGLVVVAREREKNI